VPVVRVAWPFFRGPVPVPLAGSGSGSDFGSVASSSVDAMMASARDFIGQRESAMGRGVLAIACALLFACSKPSAMSDAGTANPVPGPFEQVGSEAGAWFTSVSTDRARYAPNEVVSFTLLLSKSDPTVSVRVRYLHLFDEIESVMIGAASGTSIDWTWHPPPIDGAGYLAEIIAVRDATPIDRATIAVDVSSDWKRFPRYGYLSTYPMMSPNDQDAVMSRLNRHHISGVQFYDWEHKHHAPLATNGSMIDASWKDIANRDIYLSTVKTYLDLCHAHGMVAMSYNLLYGASANAAADGVDPTWGLFDDTMHTEQDVHPLPATWASNIYLQDPSNFGWQSYLFAKEKQMFDALAFDGWHVDQLGDRGARYTFQGLPVRLSDTFTGFLMSAQSALGVRLVMNAVSGYGRPQIADAPIDFMYEEVWPPVVEYTDLRSIIEGNSRPTVLAAYINYDLGSAPGTFNAPGVLLADAVIFASGGAHIELGESMLSREYFPSMLLTIDGALKLKLIAYYDFSVAYENLLRDGFTATVRDLSSTAASIAASPSQGAIWAFTKSKDDREVVHLINFTNATSLVWRDADGTQSPESPIADLPLHVATDAPVTRVWWASPDLLDGSPLELEARPAKGGGIDVTIPELEYWGMLVIEHGG
jgi:dextranase